MKPEDILMFHVGGAGYYGPIDLVCTEFPTQSVVIAFEAREDPEDSEIQKQYAAAGVRVGLVNKAVAEQTGKAPFFVGKHVEASSMLRPASRALDEHIGAYVASDTVQTWAEESEISHEIEVEAVALKDVIEQIGMVPDVVSIDAQGMELPILQGLGPALDLVNVVISEVEFAEVYDGQALFHHQLPYLVQHGFRLAAIFSPQLWHPGPACGQGLLTVGEALWLKDLDFFFERNLGESAVDQGITLAAVAYAFERFSYLYSLLKKLAAAHGDRVMEVCEARGYGTLVELVAAIDAHLPEYALDNKFFLNNLTVNRGDEGLSWTLDSKGKQPS